MIVETSRAISVFYSYAHADELLREELEKHLTLLQRQGLIVGWYDRLTSAGQEWAQEIQDHLNTAQIILLLVSADFLASDYHYTVEMELALKRHQLGEACVIPVMLRPVDYSNAPFSPLQALPTDGNPVTMWSNQDAAFEDIALGIRRAVMELTGQSPAELAQRNLYREDRGTADRKVDAAREKVQLWGERLKWQHQWDWHLLGQALQLAHEAVENDRRYQRPRTLLADIYHRIGKKDLARECLKRSKSLATPGPNFPGRFYKEVEEHIRSGYPFNAAGGLERKDYQPPQWFEEKYQRYWNLEL